MKWKEQSVRPTSSRQLIARLADERRLGLLLISHDLAAIRDVVDRILVMYAGEIVEEGPAADVDDEAILRAAVEAATVEDRHLIVVAHHDEIHALRDPHLLIAIDHEGGRVQRFREGFTVMPPMRHIVPLAAVLLMLSACSPDAGDDGPPMGPGTTAPAPVGTSTTVQPSPARSASR